MKSATIEFIKGLNEWIIYGDRRRVWQIGHQVKRGAIILFTLGKVIPLYLDYFSERQRGK